MSLQSHAHLAYLALERLIVTLKLAPGALVTERQLIGSLGLAGRRFARRFRSLPGKA